VWSLAVTLVVVLLVWRGMRWAELATRPSSTSARERRRLSSRPLGEARTGAVRAYFVTVNWNDV
jgi:hypothetical protein